MCKHNRFPTANLMTYFSCLFSNFMTTFSHLFFKFGTTFRKKNHGFLDDFWWLCWQFFYSFLDNFLRLFCFAFCAVQNSSRPVQKTDYLFLGGGGVKVSPRTALRLSKMGKDRDIEYKNIEKNRDIKTETSKNCLKVGNYDM